MNCREFGLIRTPGRFLALGLALAVCQFVAASEPLLRVITPRGVQRGAQHTLRFSGARIGGAVEVFLYQPGVTVDEIRRVDDNQVDVVVTVAADCTIGEHLAQIRTPRGISDYRSFYVGLFPPLAEVEPNNGQDQAQLVPMNVTAEGVVTSEDVDAWAVDLKANQKLAVEIEALRLGFLFDPSISVLDERRFEVAGSDDSPLFRQDGTLSFLAPADGRYTILVRESSYGGNDQCHYRMHIGDFPRPTAVLPAGGPPGGEIAVRFVGDPSGEFTQNVPVESGRGGNSTVVVRDGGGREAPSRFPFRSIDLPNFLEQEQLVDWPAEKAVALPVALNGILAEPGQHDWYLVSAKKGEVWEFEAYAQRLGSGCDPVLNVFKADRTHLAGNDDSRGADAWQRFEVPEDGNYYLRVMDHLQRGQADFFYRVEISRVVPRLSVSIPRIDRYSQSLQSIAVPAGNRFATVLNVNRADFGGVVEVLADSLPPGITMDARPTVGNFNVLPVVFSAAPEAAACGALVDLKARLVGENRTIEGRFSNFADFVNGEPNNAVYYGATVDRLAMAVTQPAPFRISIRSPSAPLVRDGSCNLHVTLERDEGFTGPVHLRFPFRPPGVGTNYQITIPEGQNSIDYTLNANGNAQIGQWPVFVVGFSPVEGGNLWVSSGMAELNVAEPFVKITAGRSSSEQGKPAQVLCTLEQVSPFDGEASVQLLGLPPGCTAEAKTITRETTELVFDVVTTGDSPVGNHKSLFCQVTHVLAEDSAVAVTGRTELQITAPVVVAAAPATPPPAAEPAAPAQKPLSRLEKLRAEAAGSGSGSGQ